VRSASPRSSSQTPGAMASTEPAVITVELAAGEGAMHLRWDPGPPEGGAADSRTSSPWELESEPDWRRLESIRLISARFDDGGVLGLAGLRPRGAHGHGDDVVIARLVDAEGQETTTSDALVSVEYDADGEPRRLGVELWPEAGSAPVRVAADREGATEIGVEAGRDAVPMTFRLDGIAGSGRYEIVRQG
jgi:hypothetical protein